MAGVKAVRNEIQIVPAARQEIVEAKDEEVERRVEGALRDDQDLRDADIAVEVQNGVARLTGTVGSNAQRLRAAVTARTAAGVRAVEDDLQVARR